VSGFLGGHVVNLLVQKGHRVRGTVRDVELEACRAKFQEVYGSVVEIFAIDLTEGDYTDALKGVDAVIHLACPLPGRVDPGLAIDSAVLGSTKIVSQAIDAGIKRFSIAGSSGAITDFSDMTSSKRLTEHDWNPATREQALATGDPTYIYCASKALAERAINELGKAHPDVNIAIMNPSCLVGTFAPTAIITPGNLNALSTNLYFYNALLPDSTFKTPNIGYIDVRDIALAMIAGIDTPGKTRNPLTGEWFELVDAVEYVGTLYPELKLPKLELSGQTDSMLVSEPSWKRLGVTPRPWKDTVREAAETMLGIERDWIAQGVDVDAEGGLKKNPWRG